MLQANARTGAMVFLLGAGLLACHGARAESLEHAVSTALETHPRIAELRQAVEAARTEVEIPATRRNIQVSLDGGLGRQKSSDGGSGSVISPTVRVRKLVHDGGRIDHEVKLREARWQGAESTLVSGREDLALEVVTAYLQVARTTDTLEAVREWAAGLGAIASMTDQIQRIDRGRQFDNALARSRVQRAEAELLTRSTALADARAQLAGLVGKPVAAERPVRSLAFAPADNLEGLVASHPQIKMAEATIEVAREQSVLDQLYDRPSLSIEGFVGSGNDINGRFRAVNNVGIQLVGNVSLLDGGSGAATSKASLLRLLQAERARDAVQVELLTALTRLRTLLEGSKARGDSFEQAYRQAVTLATRMREQFQAGRRPLVDLLSQETEIYQTRLSTLGELYDALLTEARMAHASGQLLSVLKIVPNIR